MLPYALTVLKPSENDLDPIARFVAAFVVFHGLLALFSPEDTCAHPLVLQRFSDSISIVAAIPELPIGFSEAPEQSPCPDVIAPGWA